MLNFWSGFEKKAMTNEKALKRAALSLMGALKNSSDPHDRRVHAYLMEKGPSLLRLIPQKIRAMGESPKLNWTHNVHPERFKSLLHEIASKKNEPGWARKTILKEVGGS